METVKVMSLYIILRALLVVPWSWNPQHLIQIHTFHKQRTLSHTSRLTDELVGGVVISDIAVFTGNYWPVEDSFQEKMETAPMRILSVVLAVSVQVG